jgi:hypothetical protein
LRRDCSGVITPSATYAEIETNAEKGRAQWIKMVGARKRKERNRVENEAWQVFYRRRSMALKL